jgi:uncharacterized protein YeaO (DUF488 family)
MRVAVRTKRIYEPSERVDGTRVLVMRLWPRGIRKERVDLWLKNLGAELTLLREYRAGKLRWSDYRKRYLAGLKSPEAQAALTEVRHLMKRGRVTLLCACHDESRCHRGILKQLLTR